MIESNEVWAFGNDSMANSLVEKYANFVSKLKPQDTLAAITRDNTSLLGDMQIVNGTAVIPITGTIFKDRNIMTEFMGATSTKEVIRMLDLAMNTPEVEKIVLHVDSGGGMVTGTQAAAQAIFEAREKGTKQIVSFVDGTAASAAYWLASAAEKVFIRDKTVMTGSIGVIVTHVDFSEANKMAGVKFTTLTAGKLKAVEDPNKPLSDTAKKEIQAQLDKINDIFTDDVARFRGVTQESVKNLEAGVFIGLEAIEHGLIDGQVKLEDLLSNTMDEEDSSNMEIQMEKEFNVSMIPADMLAQIKSEARVEEVNRIKGIEEASLAGHEALVTEMKFDASVSVADASMRILKAEQTLRANSQAAVEKETAPVVHTEIVEAKTEVSAEDTYKNDAALQAEFGSFENYDAYMGVADLEVN